MNPASLENLLIKGKPFRFSKGNLPWMKGKHHTEESKRKMSNAKIGKTLPEETKKKMSEARTGIKNHFYGKTFTEEHRQKLSLSHKGLPSHNKGRHISEEQKQKLRVANLGKKQSCKTIEKRVAKTRGMKRSYAQKKNISLACIGRTASAETKRKISFSHLKDNLSEQSRENYRRHRSTLIIPRKDTKIEIKMQELLTSLNIKYQKHFTTYHPGMGYHQVDIMICDHKGNPKIAIECDGCYWHGCKEHHPNSKFARPDRDTQINKCLEQLGIKVIRFWEHDIINNKIEIEGLMV